VIDKRRLSVATRRTENDALPASDETLQFCELLLSVAEVRAAGNVGNKRVTSPLASLHGQFLHCNNHVIRIV
jgi:hypothetical protein